MHIPTISVIMPIYNAGLYLQEAIDSILNQSFGDFELLLIDDGSIDGSRDRILSQKDPRIRIFLREHEGLVRTLNAGIAYSRAPIIARMDSDDVALPERFALQYEFLEQHPDVVVLGTGVKLIDSSGETFGPPQNHCLSHKEIINSLTNGSDSGLAHPTVMFRRLVACSIGGYREDFPVCEDADLWVRMARLGGLRALPDVLLLLRKHGGNVTTTRMGVNLESDIRMRICYQVWRQCGVDLVDKSPELWKSAEIQIQALIKQHKLLEILVARENLKKHSDGRQDIRLFPVLGRLLCQPNLACGLLFHRLRRRLIRLVTSKLVREIYQQRLSDNE